MARKLGMSFRIREAINRDMAVSFKKKAKPQSQVKSPQQEYRPKIRVWRAPEEK